MYSFVGRRSTTAETTAAAAAAHLGVTTFMFFLIFVRYFSEGSVQQHPPPYSFRKRVLVRPVMKRLFFPWKTEEKKARFARAPHGNALQCICGIHSQLPHKLYVDDTWAWHGSIRGDLPHVSLHMYIPW